MFRSFVRSLRLAPMTLFLAAALPAAAPTFTFTASPSPVPTFTPTVVSNLSLVKSVAPPVADNLQALTYTLAWSFINSGGGQSSTVQQLVDTLPAGFKYGSAVWVSGPAPSAITVNAGVLGVLWTGSPAVSEGDAGVIEVRGQAQVAAMGSQHVNVASIWGDAPGSAETWSAPAVFFHPTATPTLSATAGPNSPTPTPSPTSSDSPTNTPSVTPAAPSPTSTATATPPPLPTATPAPATPIALPAALDPGDGAIVYPLPGVEEDVKLVFRMAAPGGYRIRLFNAAGDPAGLVEAHSDSAGLVTVILPTASFAPGIYLFKVNMAYDDGSRGSLAVGKFVMRRR